MPLFVRLLLVGLFALAGGPTCSFAQFQLNVFGSRLTPTDRGSSFSDGLWGPGATLRYFTSPRLAIGLNTRFFTRKTAYQFGATSTASRESALVATGQIEYFFTPHSAWQPYVGAEIGLLHNWFRTEFTTTTVSTYRGNDSSLLLGPKAGLHYAITPTLGLGLDASYQFILNQGYTGHGLFVDAGGFVRFGRR